MCFNSPYFRTPYCCACFSTIGCSQCKGNRLPHEYFISCCCTLFLILTFAMSVCWIVIFERDWVQLRTKTAIHTSPNLIPPLFISVLNIPIHSFLDGFKRYKVCKFSGVYMKIYNLSGDNKCDYEHAHCTAHLFFWCCQSQSFKQTFYRKRYHWEEESKMLTEHYAHGLL